MVAPDISSWIGVDRHRTLERAKASKQFDSKLKILVFEADGQGKSRYCLMDKQDVLKDAVNEAMATNNGAKLGTNRIFFLDFVSNSAPVEKRKLQITDELFGIICDELQVPAYFIDTVIRDDQLGRLGFGSYLHPGEDRASGSFELSYRYTPRLQDGTLDLNGNLHYIYTRYNIRTHSSLTLCINPHIETRNLWVGLEGDDAVLKGIPANEWRDSDSAKFSVGHTRAERDLRSPLAFHILVTQMILEDWRTGLQADRQRLLDAELESGMVVNKPEGSPSSSDAKTELSPTPRPPDLEQGVPMQALDAGGPSNSDANCPDVNAPDTNENTTDPTGTRRKEVMTPKSRQERLRNLHDTTQRLTVAENSCKDIENRVTLLLRSVETLRSIPQRKEHGIDHPGRPSSSSMRNRILPSTLDREQQILESIRLSCQHSQQWTRCYKERTNIQIQLDFNRLTSDIAWEAQRDTSAMNNVAVVTTLFLPGTFVCAVFSMIFFDTDDAGYPRPSPQAYIYAAITIPLTIVVAFALWFANNGISHAWRLRDFDKLRYDGVGDGSGQPPTSRSWLRSGVLHTPW